jgi:hypothetical protein
MTRILRLTIVAAIVCVMALSAMALIGKSPNPQDGDVIIIKGGSLEIQCPRGEACFGSADTGGKYRHQNGAGKIEQIVVKDSRGNPLKTFTRARDFSDGRPSVEITYK